TVLPGGERAETLQLMPSAVNKKNSFPGSAASSCDLTLMTCLLIGSYRFCIIPLLAAFNGRDRKLWRSK
uniref:Uncharacterized protein n=1 Tax=Lates calcarifer TaxID=8187 RepID=A0A4W6BQX0_LATCA